MQSFTTSSATLTHECEKCKDQHGWIEERPSEQAYLKPVKDEFGQQVYEMQDGMKKPVTERIPIKKEVWVECECVRAKRINSLMASSHITDEFKQMTFGNFDAAHKPQSIQKMKEIAMAYVTEFRKIRSTRTNSIALLGQPGIGKTHLLCAVANNFIQKWLVPVHYFPYVEGMEDLKSSFNDGEVALAVKMERLKNVDVLFIDDLFKPVSKMDKGERVSVPRATEWQVERMFEIINYRYLNNKPVLISSELDFIQMLTIDEALASRIFEMCAAYTMTIEKDVTLNHRMRKAFGH